jgi:hypothetical protein
MRQTTGFRKNLGCPTFLGLSYIFRVINYTLLSKIPKSSKPKSDKPRLSCPGLPPRGIVQIKMSETGSRCFRCIGQMEDRWESLHAPYFVQDNQDRIMFFKVDQCRKNDNIFCVQIEFNLNGPMEFTTGTVLRLIQEDDEPTRRRRYKI